LYTPDSGLTDTYSTLADGRSCGLHCRSFGHACLHPWVIDTLSHCRQCDKQRHHECQRGISCLEPETESKNSKLRPRIPNCQQLTPC